jgi:hypothetical protein
MQQTGRIAIGGLSKHTDTNIETIRYYERVGLLPAPARSSGGYRLYGTDHLKNVPQLSVISILANEGRACELEQCPGNYKSNRSQPGHPHRGRYGMLRYRIDRV